MYVVVMQIPLTTPRVVGPFSHIEGAQTYAQANGGWHIWSIVKMEEPTVTVTTTAPMTGA